MSPDRCNWGDTTICSHGLLRTKYHIQPTLICCKSYIKRHNAKQARHSIGPSALAQEPLLNTGATAVLDLPGSAYSKLEAISSNQPLCRSDQVAE